MTSNYDDVVVVCMYIVYLHNIIGKHTGIFGCVCDLIQLLVVYLLLVKDSKYSKYRK